MTVTRRPGSKRLFAAVRIEFSICTEIAMGATKLTVRCRPGGISILE